MSTNFYLRNVKLKQVKLDSLEAIRNILLEHDLVYMTPEFEDVFDGIEDDIFIARIVGKTIKFWWASVDSSGIKQIEDFYFKEWGKYDIVDCYDNSYTWDEFEERISPYVK